jgi:hypothetical protein
MEVALGAGKANDAIAVLRDATPFADASPALLARIAALARPALYEPAWLMDCHGSWNIEIQAY